MKKYQCVIVTDPEWSLLCEARNVEEAESKFFDYVEKRLRENPVLNTPEPSMIQIYEVEK